jgi:hypothetical protein
VNEIKLFLLLILGCIFLLRSWQIIRSPSWQFVAILVLIGVLYDQYFEVRIKVGMNRETVERMLTDYNSQSFTIADIRSDGQLGPFVLRDHTQFVGESIVLYSRFPNIPFNYYYVGYIENHVSDIRIGRYDPLADE